MHFSHVFLYTFSSIPTRTDSAWMARWIFGCQALKIIIFGADNNSCVCCTCLVVVLVQINKIFAINCQNSPCFLRGKSQNITVRNCGISILRKRSTTGWGKFSLLYNRAITPLGSHELLRQFRRRCVCSRVPHSEGRKRSE